MIKIIIFLVFLSFAVQGQDIVEMPSGTLFKFHMAQILKKQNECLKDGGYRVKNQLHLVNGKLKCNWPIFQRSCYIEMDEDKNYSFSEICKLDSSQVGSHNIELKFTTKNCPILKCRPLLFTGLFTGPDIGVESLKYNLGPYISFESEEGVNLEIRSALDKKPDYNRTINKDSSVKVQQQ